MNMLICAALSFVCAWYLLKPMFSASEMFSQTADQTSLMVLLDQKTRSINMLRDLELDYSTSKLSKEEYDSIKAELSFDLAEVMGKIDKSGSVHSS